MENVTQPVGKFKYIKKDDINDFFKLNIKSSGNSLSFLDYMSAVSRIFELNF